MLEKFNAYFFNRQVKEFGFIPTSIKVDKYQYYFASRNDFAKLGKSYNKHFNSEFLSEVDVSHVNKLNAIYGVPTITGQRTINFSPFLYLPIYDMVAFFILFKILRKIFF